MLTIPGVSGNSIAELKLCIETLQELVNQSVFSSQLKNDFGETAPHMQQIFTKL